MEAYDTSYLFDAKKFLNFLAKSIFRKNRPKGNKMLNISWNNEPILTNEVFNESLYDTSYQFKAKKV